ncbi:GntR family transcriptional regulator [Scopulibacillus darangshiensis]|uniref:GntR family transcriptional regulator n=1 Tax=Scopulibacillus darangshiensis TaxID=442528 RepID=A0A4R2NP60_9BACL|nr:GntR family transcriptional regulator [Scopulibacillus darangshiensis]TCP23517.1 GntR family transcriptional regulator [Scopulibacillus darangshiensis]
MGKLLQSSKQIYKTKQEYVYQTLRDAIMHCELMPGEKLVIKNIADQLSVSTIPVREALQLLHTEELVNYSPHVGTIVTPISKSDIIEAFTVKEGLETAAVRIAVEKATKEDLAKLKKQLEAMDDFLEKKNHEDWGGLNRQFHLAITDITSMSMLKEMHVKVLNKWDRIRRYYFHEVLAHRHVQSQKEHYAIVDAMASEKSKEAEQWIRKHNLNALHDYMRHIG